MFFKSRPFLGIKNQPVGGSEFRQKLELFPKKQLKDCSQNKSRNWQKLNPSEGKAPICPKNPFKKSWQRHKFRFANFISFSIFCAFQMVKTEAKVVVSTPATSEKVREAANMLGRPIHRICLKKQEGFYDLLQLINLARYNNYITGFI